MSEKSTTAQKAFGDVAPALAEISDTVLFDNVWKRPDLKPRDRSLVTITSLISLYRVNELPYQPFGTDPDHWQQN